MSLGGHPVSHYARQGNGMPLSRYRQSLGDEVQSRMTRRIGAPQVGHRAARGGGGGGGGGGASPGGGRHDHAADGRERDGTAGVEKAKMPDFLKAIGQDMLEEPADKFDAVELSGAEAGTAEFPVGEGDDAVLQTDDTAVGDGDFEDIGSEVFEGGRAIVIGLTVDVPGDGPDLGTMCSSRPACASRL